MIHKLSIDLFDVHKNLSVGFLLFLDYLDTDKVNDKYRSKPIINKFIYNGNKYFKIVPRGFISLNISNTLDKKEKISFNPSAFCTMGAIELFYFKNELEQLISKYYDPKIPLYKIDERNRLLINSELANQYTRMIRVHGNKVVKFIPCVVESEMEQYEGCAMYINNIQNVTYLTISEMCFLLSEMKKIDIVTLTLNSIQTYHLLELDELDEAELPKKEPVTEQPEEEIIDSKPIIKIEEPNELEGI